MLVAVSSRSQKPALKTVHQLPDVLYGVVSAMAAVINCWKCDCL